MKLFNQINIYAIYVFWVAFVVNLVQPFPGDWNKGVLYLGLTLLVVHFLEFVVLFKKLKGINHAAPKDFAMVMLIGLFHWVPLLRKS